MKKCRHPNVVRLLEVIDDPQQDKIYMGIQFFEFGANTRALTVNL